MIGVPALSPDRRRRVAARFLQLDEAAAAAAAAARARRRWPRPGRGGRPHRPGGGGGPGGARRRPARRGPGRRLRPVPVPARARAPGARGDACRRTGAARSTASRPGRWRRWGPSRASSRASGWPAKGRPRRFPGCSTRRAARSTSALTPTPCHDLAPALEHEPGSGEGLRLRAEALDAIGDPGAPAAYAAAAAKAEDADDLRAKQALAQIKLGDPAGGLEVLDGVEPDDGRRPPRSGPRLRRGGGARLRRPRGGHREGGRSAPPRSRLRRPHGSHRRLLGRGRRGARPRPAPRQRPRGPAATPPPCRSSR